MAGGGGHSACPAAWAQQNCRYPDWKIPGQKLPCVSQAGSLALTHGAGGEASGEVSTTSLSCSPELSGTLRSDVSHDSHSHFARVLFPLDFPCTQSFLKESQEVGNVPVVTLAGIAPGWISQAAKGCPGKESPQQLLELLSCCHLVFCPPQYHRTHFIAAESVVMNLLVLKILIPVITLLTPPPCSSSRLCGEDRASPAMQVQGDRRISGGHLPAEAAPGVGA